MLYNLGDDTGWHAWNKDERMPDMIDDDNDIRKLTQEEIDILKNAYSKSVEKIDEKNPNDEQYRSEIDVENVDDSAGTISIPAIEVSDYGPNISDPGKATRYAAGKAPLSHIMDFPRAMKQLSLIAEYGAHKYDRGNFQKGQKATVTIDCMMRHLVAWWCGEDIDPESKQHHLGHFLWNAVVLTEDMVANRPGDDDRTFNRKDLEKPDIKQVK